MNHFLCKLAGLGSIIPILFLSTGITSVFAGFGITPPYVRNTSLTRNSTYEQQILLVRGDTNIAQKAEISVDAPEIQDWITIVEGDEIKMPKGLQKVPMTVRIEVPGDVDFKDYEEYLWIDSVALQDPANWAIAKTAGIDIIDLK